jgi:hypothetical protein
MNLLVPKTFALFLIMFGILIGASAAYEAESPSQAEAIVENQSVNATSDLTADSAVNRTALRAIDRTFVISEWVAPRYHPWTDVIPAWAFQLVIGGVVTTPVVRYFYIVLSQSREVREA